MLIQVYMTTYSKKALILLFWGFFFWEKLYILQLLLIYSLVVDHCRKIVAYLHCNTTDSHQVVLEHNVPYFVNHLLLVATI